MVTRFRDIPGVAGLRHLFINLYFLETADGVVLVDAGLRGFAPVVQDALQKLGYRPADVTWIVLTHAHFDHTGGAAELAELTGARLAGHAADLAYYEQGGVGILPPRIRRMTMQMPGFIRRRRIDALPIQLDWTLTGGETIGGWQVLHTPGHTPGTVSLYQPEQKVLIAGNWLMMGVRLIQGSASPRDRVINIDNAQVIASTRQLAALQCSFLLCSHESYRDFPRYRRALNALVG